MSTIKLVVLFCSVICARIVDIIGLPLIRIISFASFFSFFHKMASNVNADMDFLRVWDATTTSSAFSLAILFL